MSQGLPRGVRVPDRQPNNFCYTFSMNQRVFLSTTGDGKVVHVDMESSHAATHFQSSPKLLEAVKRIIPTLNVAEDVVRVDVYVEEAVGHTDLVETDEDDEIVYALRPRRAQYSRFVKHKQSVPSSWITLDLRKTGENEYELYTAFVGRLTPSFPGGDYLPQQSREFWSHHALVWGSQDIVLGTETTECPW